MKPGSSFSQLIDREELMNEFIKLVDDSSETKCDFDFTYSA